MHVTVQRLQAAAENAKALHMPFMEGMVYYHLVTLQPTDKAHSHKAKQLFRARSKFYMDELSNTGEGDAASFAPDYGPAHTLRVRACVRACMRDCGHRALLLLPVRKMF